jgi:hypothetical protein
MCENLLMACILSLGEGRGGEEERGAREIFSFAYTLFYFAEEEKKPWAARLFLLILPFSLAPLLPFTALFFTSFFLHLLYTTGCVAASQRSL